MAPYEAQLEHLNLNLDDSYIATTFYKYTFLTLCISCTLSSLASSSLRIAAACSSVFSSWQKKKAENLLHIDYLFWSRILSRTEIKMGKFRTKSFEKGGRYIIYLHGVVEKLMFKLFDTENLLEKVVQLFLGQDFVSKHGRRRPLARPSRLLVCIRWRKMVAKVQILTWIILIKSTCVHS